MNFSTKAVTDIANILATEANQAIEKGEIKDITEMENWIREVTKMVGQQAFQQTLEQEDQKLGSSVECECGGLAKRISTRPAKIVSVFGVVEYCRSYYGCQHCGKKKHEVDKQLGIQPGEVSPALSKLLTIAGVETAIEKGVKLLKEFLLIDISDNTIRKYTQWAGEKQAQVEARWIAESHEEAWLQARERSVVDPPERLYGSIDGAHVPIGDEWRELKTLGWYRVDKVYGQKQPKAQDITCHTDIKPAQQFGSLLWATCVRRMADKARELIFVCDGAAWI